MVERFDGISSRYFVWLEKYKKAIDFVESYKKDNGIYELDESQWVKTSELVGSDNDKILKWILDQRKMVLQEFNLQSFNRRLAWDQIEMLQRIGIVEERSQFTLEEKKFLSDYFGDISYGKGDLDIISIDDFKGNSDEVIRRMSGWLFKYVSKFYYHVDGQNFTIEDYIQEGYAGLIEGIKSYKPENGNFGQYLNLAIFKSLKENLFLRGTKMNEEISVVDREFSKGNITLEMKKKMDYIDSRYDNWEINKLLGDKLKKLDDRSYYVLMSKVFGGLTLEAIAKNLGVSKAYVGQLYDKAMKNLSTSSVRNYYKEIGGIRGLVFSDWFDKVYMKEYYIGDLVFEFGMFKDTKKETDFWKEKMGFLTKLYDGKVGNEEEVFIKKRVNKLWQSYRRK